MVAQQKIFVLRGVPDKAHLVVEGLARLVGKPIEMERFQAF